MRRARSTCDHAGDMLPMRGKRIPIAASPLVPREVNASDWRS
ncbi:hypothetical protein RMSM_02673 [Rhodopirellula maiorica SM1]|uniref:Uncharacterized protein n=1 Tax=Rhodopirellula maiorica SM1 TaxID=1265738 RepID=M5RMH7_9BACT|nr:hypothetical protein RMSM_02673 [Rhodopirellula maiorica SM1]